MSADPIGGKPGSKLSGVGLGGDLGGAPSRQVRATRLGRAVEELNSAIRAGEAPQRILEMLCARIRELTGAREAAVLIGDRLVPPFDPVVVEAAARQRHPLRLDRALYVPIPARGPTPGVLGAMYRRRAPEPDRLEPLAAVAGLVLAAAGAPDDLQEQAAARERERLARELHDSVVQTLYGISLGAGTAAEQLHLDPAHARRSLDWIKETAAAGLTDLRGLILRLRPEALAGSGLTAALGQLLESLHALPGRHTTAQLDAEPAVSAEVEESLYRIAQEALCNAAKHAQAGQVTLRLFSETGSVVLEVGDDGVGFLLDGGFAGRLGIRSMRERAALCGGRLDIISTPGRGTLVRATFPAAH